MTRFLYTKLLTLLIASSLGLSACKGAPSAPTVPTADLQAQIAQTMEAVATDAQATMKAAVPTAAPPADTPLPSATLAATATLAPAQALPPTETPAGIAIATATSEIIIPTFGTTAHINTNTNCRTGPSTAYPVVFTAQEGANLKVVSNTADSHYIIVENPSSPGQTCWLWTEYVDISGNIAGLPVATLPVLPTLAMNFTVSFLKVVECTNWSLAFKVVSTGATTLQSYKVVAQDLNENTQETTTKNDFNERQACRDTENIPYLNNGDTGFIYADDFPFDPSGHSIKATITICSNNDLSSVCMTQVLSFKP